MSELGQRIQDVIQNEPVAVFMKGTPQFVMCGNSDRALRALREAGAPVTGVDVLADPAIRQLLNAITLQMGPQVMLAAKVLMAPGLSIEEAVAKINKLEKRIKAQFPEVAWCFIEPDDTD